LSAASGDADLVRSSSGIAAPPSVCRRLAIAGDDVESEEDSCAPRLRLARGGGGGTSAGDASLMGIGRGQVKGEKKSEVGEKLFLVGWHMRQTLVSSTMDRKEQEEADDYATRSHLVARLDAIDARTRQLDEHLGRLAARLLSLEEKKDDENEKRAPLPPPAKNRHKQLLPPVASLLPKAVREFLKRVSKRPLALGSVVTLWWEGGGVSVDWIDAVSDGSALVAWLSDPDNAAYIARIDV
jgi:hypothetical protein